jgi:hypothetical protein
VVCAEKGVGFIAGQRLRRLVREYGLVKVASRLLANGLVGHRHAREECQELDRLLDGEQLRDWWRGSGIEPVLVPDLNHPEARSRIAALEPDIMVRVSGGILHRGTFSLARLATLNIHHGIAPRIRGMWSIPWGIIEGRDDWIGATVHVIDDGIDTGRVLWRGQPQLTPGDTGTTLFFRAHLQAVEALVRLTRVYAEGATPAPWPAEGSELSVYRSALGLGAWLRYLYLRRGKHAPVLLERAFKC